MEIESEQVKIPEILIRRLQGLGPHFVFVAKRNKNPFEDDWQKPENDRVGENNPVQARIKPFSDVVPGHAATETIQGAEKS